MLPKYVWTLPSAILLLTACKKDAVTPQPTAPLVSESANRLQFLREKEKLARDVPLFAAQLYLGAPILETSLRRANPHGQNTRCIKFIRFERPCGGKANGEFPNVALQNLYSELTVRATIGLAAALWVGATIEDLDLSHIRNMEQSVNMTVDMQGLYTLLSCGSRNHLRSFICQLQMQRATCVPQYLNIETYDAILAGSHRNCNQP